MLKVLFFAAIVFIVFHTPLGAPMLHYLHSAGETIAQSFSK
jgi:hypothetical protein